MSTEVVPVTALVTGVLTPVAVTTVNHERATVLVQSALPNLQDSQWQIWGVNGAAKWFIAAGIAVAGFGALGQRVLSTIDVSGAASIELRARSVRGNLAGVNITLIGFDPQESALQISADASVTLNTAEQDVVVLDTGNPVVTASVDPGAPSSNAPGSVWRLYATAGGFRTLYATATLQQGQGPSDLFGPVIYGSDGYVLTAEQGLGVATSPCTAAVSATGLGGGGGGGSKGLYVNVQDFGAKCVGPVHDDTSAIQACLDSISESGGATRTVWFPSGTEAGDFYATTKPLIVDRSNLETLGENKNGTIIRSDAFVGPIFAVSHAGGGPFVVADGAGQNMVLGPVVGPSNQFLDLRNVPWMVDLIGSTSLSVEGTFINDDTVAPASYEFLYCHSGALDGNNAGVSLEIGIQPGSDANHSNLVGYLKTSVGGGTITIADAVVKGQKIYVALDWDGATLRLFYGAPGAMTAHQSLAASGVYQMTWFEGCWLGQGLSLSWPTPTEAYPPMAGQAITWRVSNFSRYNADFVAPLDKLPTDDAHNLNVGGVGKNTIYLTNFETYRSCWHGYTWAFNNGRTDVYNLNHIFGNTPAIVFAAENLTLQSQYGSALMCNRAVDGNFDELVLRGGIYGLAMFGDSFFTNFGKVTIESLGPPMVGARLPYPVAGALFTSADCYFEELAVTGSFGFTINVTGGGAFDYCPIAPNGYALVPVFLNAASSFANSRFTFIAIDDEDVGTSPPGRGNWVTCLYIANPNVAKFDSCTLSVQRSNDIPIVTLDSLSAASSKGIVTFDSCVFVGSDNVGANSPVAAFAGTSAQYPTTPVAFLRSSPSGRKWADDAHAYLVTTVDTEQQVALANGATYPLNANPDPQETVIVQCTDLGATSVTVDGSGHNIVRMGVSAATDVLANGAAGKYVFNVAKNVWMAQ